MLFFSSDNFEMDLPDTYEITEKLLKLSPITMLPGKKAIPTLIGLGGADRRVPCWQVCSVCVQNSCNAFTG